MFFTTAALLVYLFFCLQGRESRSRGFAPAGVSLLLGLAILTRPNALLLLIPFAVHAAVRSRPGCRAARAVLLLVPALCCAGVWGLRNQQRLGTFTLATVGGLNWYLGHNPDYAANPGLDRADYAAANRLRARHPEMNEAEIDRLLFQTGVDFIRRHPWQTIVDCFRKVGVWFTPRVPAYGPTVPLIAACALAAAGWREWRAGRMCARRLALQRAALAAILALAGLWMFQIIAFRRGRLDIAPLPFTTPLYVLSMGIPALLFLRTQFAVRGLFVGLIASQLCVAVAFIPLSRLRWSIDPLLIIALAVGVDRLCHWLAAGGQPEESPPPRTTMLE
ncbi:MAG: hypothetical protein ACE5EX_10800, partial [Phycisphaerae bacterium]